MYRKSLFTKAEFINAKLNYKIQVYGCKIRKKQNSKQVIFFARKNTNNSRNLFSQKTPSRAPYLREPSPFLCSNSLSARSTICSSW